MEQYRIDFESMAWESPADGVRFKAYEQGGKKLRLVKFSKGIGPYRYNPIEGATFMELKLV